jgi:signal transduction histidine kinase
MAPPRPDEPAVGLVAELAEEQARLGRLVWTDIATACTAVAVMLATYAFVAPEGWLLVLSALVAASGAVMAGSLRPLGRGDLAGTVTWLAVANWTVAPAAAAIATFAWPLMMLAALLPAVIAAPYLPARRLGMFVGISLAVAVLVIAAGTLQDVTGFTDRLPDWVPPAIVLAFVPFLAAMLLTTAVQNSRRLQGALAETRDANRALQASRARLVSATDRERRRVERDLHDGAQQRLVALGLRLTSAQELARSRPGEVVGELAALRVDVREAHRELRELAQGLYPPVLTQHGLGAALRAVADRCAVPVHVRADPRVRHGADVEATVYFCCVEALQNVEKHAGASRAEVDVDVDGAGVRFTVSDDGAGFDPAVASGTGLDNLRDRLGAVGGHLEVRSAPGRGTTVAGWVPAPEPAAVQT